MELGPASYVILGMLHKGLETGYEIKAFMERTTRFFWAISYGQIYPELKRLEEAGLVEGRPAPTGKRRRTAYRLTAAGEEALGDWIASPGATYELRDENLLKLFFADAVEREEALGVVREMRAYHEDVIERLREIEPLARQADAVFPYVVLQGGLGLHGWVVEWCKRTERELEAGGPPERAGGEPGRSAAAAER